jgi:flavorubredoxin
MRSTELTKDFFWVGAVDWDLRDFHGYSTEKGSTYNAFLLRDAKTALFDTVKIDLLDDLVENIKEVTEVDKINYIVVNHAEMDHTGSLPQMIEMIRPEKVFCTADGQKALAAHFHGHNWPLEIVKDGDAISLGERTIRFVSSPMLHWPESMASFIQENNILISNDIFGQHWATSERFDDEVDQGELFWQAAKYYANIFLPMSGAVRKFMEKLRALNVKPSMLAVDHGLVWRAGIDKIFERYDRWSRQESRPVAVIVYDTMWESTAKMARAIGRGIAGQGASVKLFDLRINHRSDIITEMLEARAVIFGSPVLNKGILPKMADMLTYTKALRPADKIGAAFGSYGWQDTSVKQLNAAMEELKWRVIDPGIAVNYVPTKDDLKRCEALGEKIRQAMIEK